MGNFVKTSSRFGFTFLICESKLNFQCTIDLSRELMCHNFLRFRFRFADCFSYARLWQIMES